MFRYAGYYFGALFALALLAFWKSYVRELPGDFALYTHAHAIVMVCWFVVWIAQPFLIRRDQRGLHRALGKVSYVLVPAFVATTLLLTHSRIAALDEAQLAEAGYFFYLPIVMVVLLVIPYALAIRYRHTVALHARFMICTSLALFDPVIGRILGFYFPPLPDPDLMQVITYGASAAVLTFLVVRERKQRTGRYVYPAMLALTTAAYAGFFTLARTDEWLAFVMWLREL